MAITKEILQKLKEDRMFRSDSDSNIICQLIEMVFVCEEMMKHQQKEIEEHCETKGKLGKQVFALTKRVDKLVDEKLELQIRIDKVTKICTVDWINRFLKGE
jgi:hypothetical protein